MQEIKDYHSLSLLPLPSNLLPYPLHFFPKLLPHLYAMKKLLSVLLITCLAIIAQAQINIIPQPSSVKQGSGNFTVSSATILQYSSNDAEVKRIAGELNAAFKRAAGLN